MNDVKVVDVYLEPVDKNASGKIRLENRRGSKDRRKLHTYIANDRRSGIANRRKQPPARPGNENK